MNQWDDLNNELLSAYFDGELSDDERARVEQLLASGQHQQMLDDLQLIRDSVNALPKFSLPNDFHERVLDEALKQMGESEILVRQPIASPRPTDYETSTRRFGWRQAVAAIGAVAAALLIAFVVYQWRQINQDNGPGRDIVIEAPDPLPDPDTAPTCLEVQFRMMESYVRAHELSDAIQHGVAGGKFPEQLPNGHGMIDALKARVGFRVVRAGSRRTRSRAARPRGRS